jgi:AcrR family transcriptional regulator
MARIDGRLERGTSTRERILDAAIELIAAHGLSGATQRNVAELAGVSLANVTYHFRSAKDLLVAAMRRAAGISVARQATAEVQMMSGEKTLEDITIEYIRDHRSGAFPAGVVALELSMAAVRDPDLRSSAEDNIDALRSALRATYGSELDEAGVDGVAAAAFTGLLLTELGSNRDPGSDETRRRVRTLIELLGLQVRVDRLRADRAAQEGTAG